MRHKQCAVYIIFLPNNYAKWEDDDSAHARHRRRASGSARAAFQSGQCGARRGRDSGFRFINFLRGAIKRVFKLLVVYGALNLFK